MSSYEHSEWLEYFEIRAERDDPKPKPKYKVGR